MNFADFVLNCYLHITSHVSQAFTSFTHYISYSLLNIVYVTVYVFGLTNQVCKYFEFFYAKTDLMLENLRRMFENLNFGKTGFKTYVFEKLCTLILMHFIHNFQCFKEFMHKTGLFFKTVFFFGISIDRGYFSINQNWF